MADIRDQIAGYLAIIESSNEQRLALEMFKIAIDMARNDRELKRIAKLIKRHTTTVLQRCEN
jgi:hypothetical protein